MDQRRYFKKENWKIVWYFPQLKDGNYKITVAKQNRSLAQNRLYWGFFLKQIALFYKEQWNIISIEDLHEIFKKRLPKKRVYSDYNDKEYIEQEPTTSDLKTNEFKQYMESINEELKDRYGRSVDLNVSEDDLLYWENYII